MASVTQNSESDEDFEFEERRVRRIRKGMPLHRIADVRQQQGVSLRTVSRRTGIDVSVLKQQELPSCDMKLSDLYLWQQMLDVPIQNLLQDHDDELSDETQTRASMVKLMKTVVALSEVSSSPRVARLVMMLREQLVGMMPELETIGGWPSYGTRRSADQVGKIAENPIDLYNLGID